MRYSLSILEYLEFGGTLFLDKGFVEGFPEDGAPANSAETRFRGDGRTKVLVLDDEVIIADSIALILNHGGFDAVARYDGASALEFLQKQCPDILLTDVVMPNLNGIQVADKVRSHCPGTRIVLISGNAATRNLLEEACPSGAHFEVLPKPIHPTHLLQILRG